MGKHLVLGGPGAGKTEYLIRKVESALESGMAPEAIAFVSFTQKAANEARDRAAKRFGLEAESLPHFRTIHSMCYRALGLKDGDVVDYQAKSGFSKWIGEPMTFKNPMEDDWDGYGAGITDGDRMMFMVGYAAAKQITLQEAWEGLDLGRDLEYWRVERFAEGWVSWKQRKGLLDFSDMLDRYNAGGLPIPGIRMAVIDEAQDLSRAQWQVVDKAFSEAQDIYVGGDDLQAIFTWSGADVDHFLGLRDYERHVLPVSHRLKRDVFDYAESLAAGIQKRYAKDWSPRADGGAVVRGVEPDQVPVGQDGTWYMLARNNVMLRELEGMCFRAGMNYTGKFGPAIRPEDVAAIQAWERLQKGLTVDQDTAKLVLVALRERRILAEKRPYNMQDLLPERPDLAVLPWDTVFHGIPHHRRSFYNAVTRNGGSLLDKPAVTIGTIHSVKGGEADHVLLLSDCSRLTHENATHDDELRVAYVGVTRARETVWISQPTGLWTMPF